MATNALTPQIPATPAPVGPLKPPTNMTPPTPTTPGSAVAGGHGVRVPAPVTAPAPTATLAPPQPAATPTAPAPRPVPATPIAPPPPAQTQNPIAAARQAMPWLDGLTSRVQSLGERAVMADPNRPPLVGAGLTANLPEGIRGPAEGLLGMAQRGFQNNPGMFAQVVGGMGKPLVSPLLNTPAGMPMMAGLYGMLTGGESGDAAYQYFKPVIDKFRSQTPTG